MEDRCLFRGKRVDNGEWVEGYFYKTTGYVFPKQYESHSACFYYIAQMQVDPETIGQCTGLKDKNSKLIFERDILLDEYNRVWHVKWARGCFRLKLIHDPDPRYDDDYAVRPELLGNFSSEYVEIISAETASIEEKT